METVVRRRRATETLSYLLTIEVDKGKLLSHSREFMMTVRPTKATQRSKHQLRTLTVIQRVNYLWRGTYNHLSRKM